MKSNIIKELPCDFWMDLQYFHDNDSYWNKRKGLSECGLGYYKRMKSKILDNDY